MTRIFSTLAVVAVMFMAVTLFLGLSVDNLPELYKRYEAASQEKDTEAAKTTEAKIRVEAEHRNTHWIAGIGSAVLVLLVNSVAITYFVGTSRWCKEVGSTYQLNPTYLERGQKNKRRNFPWALLSMCMMIAVAAFGAMADVYALTNRLNLDRTAQWITPHFLIACLNIAVFILCAFMQFQNISQQGELMQEMMGEVQRIRKEKGLD